MVTKIIACSDIHIPQLKGIDEIKEILSRFLTECKKIVENEDGPENVRIVVAGDIFHNKNQITPESIMAANWFFSELDKICKTFIVIGNHDFLMNNTGRVDSLSPLFEIGSIRRSYRQRACNLPKSDWHLSLIRYSLYFVHFRNPHLGYLHWLNM